MTTPQVSLRRVGSDEMGSGLAPKREGLVSPLEDQAALTIVNKRRGRLARFDVEHLAATLLTQGRLIVVVENNEVDHDMVRDMTEVATIICARLLDRARSQENGDQGSLAAPVTT